MRARSRCQGLVLYIEDLGIDVEDLVRLENVVRDVTCIEDLVLDIEYLILDIEDGSSSFNI